MKHGPETEMAENKANEAGVLLRIEIANNIK
jgi:hypothetical protein